MLAASFSAFLVLSRHSSTSYTRRVHFDVLIVSPSTPCSLSLSLSPPINAVQVMEAMKI
jgi:hypothetical protein